MKRRSLVLSAAAASAAAFVRAEDRPFAVYMAGPLFTEAERGFITRVAGMLRERGVECFVPHEQPLPDPVDASAVFRLDQAGLQKASAMVAWIDGADVDSGTACEIGLFSELVRRESWRKGIVGLATDLRYGFRRDTPGGGMNLFVAGAVLSAGRIVRDVDAAVKQVIAWKSGEAA
jgi:hypothetical protein